MKANFFDLTVALCNRSGAKAFKDKADETLHSYSRQIPEQTQINTDLFY